MKSGDLLSGITVMDSLVVLISRFEAGGIVKSAQELFKLVQSLLKVFKFF